jgi:16S rRNA (cytidine1402-2'-O)-methyltransferase
MPETGVFDAALPAALYVVGTPIGNVGDLSPRARDVLAAVAVIACEDTRHTGRLLTRLGIRQRLLAHHEHNVRESARGIIRLIEEGDAVALVSDAGMPTISDPGLRVVQLAHERGVRVVAVPGPSAVIAALSLSGLPTDRFSFEGFLAPGAGRRRTQLERLAQERRLFGGSTLVFFEAAGRSAALLEALVEALGDVEVALCRELTKRHETVLRMRARALLEVLREHPPRGEIVLIADTRSAEPPPREESGAGNESSNPWVEEARTLFASSCGEREVVRALRRRGVPKEQAREAASWAARCARREKG